MQKLKLQTSKWSLSTHTNKTNPWLLACPLVFPIKTLHCLDDPSQARLTGTMPYKFLVLSRFWLRKRCPFEKFLTEEYKRKLLISDRRQQIKNQIFTTEGERQRTGHVPASASRARNRREPKGTEPSRDSSGGRSRTKGGASRMNQIRVCSGPNKQQGGRMLEM